MTKAKRIYIWKDPSRLAWGLTFAMGANILVHLGLIALSVIYGGASFYDRGEENLSGPQGVRLLADLALCLVYLLCLLVAFWIVRVSRNAHVFKPGMKISPAGAIGWYFVPFASLYKPYEAMSEIWQASASPAEGGKGELLNWWWGIFLLSNLIRGVGAAVKEPTLSVSIGALGDALAIAVSLILVVLAWRLTRMQVAKHSAWSVFSDDEPPPQPGVLERVTA